MPFHRLIPLSYLGTRLARSRVLLFNGDFELAEFIAGFNTRQVVAVSQDNPAGVWPDRTGTPGLEHQLMAFDDLRFRDRAFDVVVVPDLTALPAPAAALPEILRVLGNDGHALVCGPNPACDLRLSPYNAEKGIDYYDMYDMLCEQFESVQMVGQSPFVGYTVADLSAADEALNVSFDDSLLQGDSEEIEWFLALCGATPVSIDPYSVIQIPLVNAGLTRTDDAAIRAEAAVAEERARGAQIKAELDQARTEIGNRGVRIESLEKDLENELLQSEAARARAVQIAKELDEQQKKAQKKGLEQEYKKRTQGLELQSSVQNLTRQLRLAEERAQAAESGRDGLVDRMRADAAELDHLRERLETAKDKARRSEEQRQKLSDEVKALTGNLEEAEKKARDAQSNQVSVTAIQEEATRNGAAVAEEIAGMENRLREKAAALAESEAEIARRESIIRDLVVEVERKTGALSDTKTTLEASRDEIEEDGETRGENSIQDGLNQKIAELEGRLQASNWRVEELEARNQELERLLEAARERGEKAAKSSEALERRARLFEEEAGQRTERSIALQGDLDQAKKRIAALETQLGEANAAGGRLEQNIGNLVENAEKTKTQFLETDRQARETLAANVALREQLAAVTTELHGAHAQLGEAERRLKDETARSESLQSTIAALRQDLENEAIRTRQAGADAARHAGNADAFKKQNELKNAALAEHNLELETVQAVLADLREEIAGLEKKAAASSGQLQNAVEEANERARSFESEWKLAHRRAESLEEALAEARRGKDRLESALGEAKQKVEILEDTLRGKEDVTDDIYDRAEKAEKKAEELQAEIEAQKKEVSHLKQSVESANRATADRTKALADAQKARDDAVNKLRQETDPTADKGDTGALETKIEDQERLLASLTAQLEEREKRSTRLARQVKELGNQLKNHETDVVAWEMELKFRNTRISQLETETTELQKKLDGQALRSAPQSASNNIEGAVSSIWSGSPEDDPEALRAKVGQLNEALGDRDAELLVLHSQCEESERRREMSRNAIEEILKNSNFDDSLNEQFKNLVKSMK